MEKEFASLESATDHAYRAIKEKIAQYQRVPGQKITYGIGI